MGKDIVYQESPNEPGERSRVWSKDDVNHDLTNNTGANKVTGIQAPWGLSPISLNAKSFSEMKKLRYISMSRMMKYESFSGDIDYLSSQLRWLDWQACPLQCFPSNFQANKLVELNITSRKIRRLWEGRKNFSKLTCMNLKELPDFSGIPNLKALDLSYCTRLVEVPDSIQVLHNLVILNVDGCSNLIMLPRIIDLESVETISISDCKLEKFSVVGEEMVFLRKLDLSGTCIKKLHPSITLLIGLEELKLRNCKNLTTLPYNLCELHNLKDLDASNCPKLVAFPEIQIKMDSMRELLLSGSGIRELDQSIGNLIGLKWLFLSGCKNLTTLPYSIYGLRNLEKLYLFNRSKLVRFPTRSTNILNVDGCSLSLPRLRWLGLRGCTSLSDCDFLMTLDCWETLFLLDLSRNNFVSLPACITKFVNLRWLYLNSCKRLREIPELPPNVEAYTSGCEPTLVNPLKRQRTAAGGQASMVHFAYELAISPVPMFPDLHSACHSTTTPQLQYQGEPTDLLRLSLNSSEPTKPRGTVIGDQDQWLSLSVAPTLEENGIGFHCF